MNEHLPAEKNVWHRNVPARISEYLGNGGLFNPELMDHEAVRDILIDARDVIEIVQREIQPRRRRQSRCPHGVHELNRCERCD